MARQKKASRRSALFFAIILAGLSICGSTSVRARGFDTYTPITQTAELASYTNSPLKLSSATSSDSQSIIIFVMNRFEGPGLVVNDNGHGPSRWGILGRSNGMSYQDIVNLSAEKAAEIYKTNYWNAIDADNLPPNMRLLAFNAAVLFGPRRALDMIQESRNDPQMLLSISSEFCRRLAAENPSIYGNSLRNWISRHNMLAQHLDGSGEVPGIRMLAGAGDSPSNRSSYRWSHRGIVASRVPSPDVVAAGTFSPSSNADDSIRKDPFGIALGAVLPWTMLFTSFSYRRRRQPEVKKNRAHNYDDPPLVLVSGEKRLPRGMSDKRGGASVDNTGGFSDKEYNEFLAIFGKRPITTLVNKKRWRVNYGDNAHVLVERNKITINGDEGIEDTIRYAAVAWNNRCQITGATPETLNSFTAAAQKLVDDGVISPGFVIEGIGPLYPKSTRPVRPAPPGRRSPHLEAAEI